MNAMTNVLSSGGRLTRLLGGLMLGALILVPTYLTLAQEPPSAAVANSAAATPSSESETRGDGEKTSAASTRANANSTRKPSTSRLPPFFASLVDSRQRGAIYKIRAEKAAKIAELEKQLEDLRKQEMSEIEAVLTDEQRKQLESLRAVRASKAPPAGT